MGNNSIQEAIEKGSVIISMKVGHHKVKGVLHEVLHVLGLVKNLFLISKATTQGLKIEFEQDGCSIKNNVGEVLAKAIQENRLYKLLYSQVLESVQVVEYLESANTQIAGEKDNLTIWHEKFGHLRDQNLKLLVQKKLITKMDPKLDCQLAFYVGCANGKRCKNPFQKGDPKKIRQSPFELVHTYLCKPMKPTTV
jgi:hypothetical protein